MIEPTDVDGRNADMDAWGLTGDQRTHHLRRLHAYHRRIGDLYWRRYDRTTRAEGWFALAAIVSAVLVWLVMW